MAVARPEDLPSARPNGQAPDGDLSPPDWGRHLRSDYRHDGLDPAIPYNIGRDTNAAKLEEIKIVGGERVARYFEMSEEEFMSYATNLNYITAQNVFKARMAARLEWRMATETEEFDGTAPRLFDAGNQAMSIVTDAGKYLTTYLGAQNAISFGMCIDPAVSGISPDKRPVFYDVPVGSQPVFIDLIQFGFDPTIVRGIWIVRLLGASIVKSLWIMGDGLRIDPVTRRRYPAIPIASAHDARVALAGIDPAALGGKVINQTTPEKAGYYTSNAGAKEIGVRAVEQDLYKMGKTLGDTMIVASAMKTFKRFNYPASYEIVEEYPNPYYGVGEGYDPLLWKNHFNTANPYPYAVKPSTVIVKTGDLLNSIRAIFKGVPVIMERQARGTVPKFYEFYPGMPAPEQIIDAIPPGYDRIIADCSARYDALIANIRALIVGPTLAPPPERTPSRLIYFSGEGRSRLVMDAAALVAAKAYLEEMIVGLENLKTVCTVYLAAAKETIVARIAGLGADMTIESIEPIQQIYNKHVQEMVLISPQTASVTDDAGKPKPIVVVGRPGVGGLQIIEGVFIKNTEIHILAAFTAISNGNEPVLNGIKRQFLDLVPPVAAMPARPADVAAGPTVLESIRISLGQWVSGLFAQFRAAVGAAGGQVGGNREGFIVDWGRSSGYALSSDVAAMTVGLVEYMAANGIGADALDRLTLIYVILTMTDATGASVEDYTDRRIADVIRHEFVQLKYMDVLSFPTISTDRLVQDPDSDGGAGIAVTYETIPLATRMMPVCYLFSAFAAHVNANNAEGLGGTDELVGHFRLIESLFLEGVVRELAAPAAVAPAPVAAAPPAFPASPVPGGEAVYLETPVKSSRIGPLEAAAARRMAETAARREAEFVKSRAREKATRRGKLRTDVVNALLAKQAAAQAAYVPPPGGMAGGRRRTFRRKHAKKDKNAADTA